jgi:hypothetical protein
MKTSKIILLANKNNIEAPQKKAKAGNGFNYLLFFFMLSWVAFLPSCAVEVRTPQPEITIESHQHRFRHHHEYRRSHEEHRDRDDRNDRDDYHR